MEGLKEKIKESGFTKAHVAKILNINPATLSRIISDKQGFTSQDLKNRIRIFMESH